MKPLDCGRRLLPFVLLFSLCRAQAEPSPNPNLVLDVRDIVRVERDFQPAAALDASFVPSPDEIREGAQPALEISDLVSLVRESTGPMYWEQDGTDIRAEDTGFLTVVCGEEMKAKVRSALAQIRQMLFESVLVEVHELPGSVLKGRRAVLTDAEADAMLAQVGEHRQHFGLTNPRKPLLLESRRTQNRVLGLDAKVATESSVLQLDVGAGCYGASWTVHAMRTVDETMLVTISGSERELEPTKGARAVPAGDEVARLELAKTRLATCHASAYLRPGQALLLGTDSPLGKVLCVRIHATGAHANGTQGSSEIGELTAYPVATIVRGGIPAQNLQLPNSEAWLFPEEEGEPMPAVMDDGRLQEWLKYQVSPSTWDGSPNTMCCVDAHLFVHADPANQQAVADHLIALQAIDRKQFDLEVRFGEIGPDALAALRADQIEQLAEALPQRSLSTVSASREVRISATRHTPYVRGYDVEIASGSATAVPRIDSVAQGFLLRGTVAPANQGKVMLDLDLTMLAHDDAQAVFDPKAGRLGSVDRVDVRENKVRGASAVALDKWTLLHLSPVEGTASHVAVVVRVRSL
ncbi:MAG: hypothetical protein H6838_00395 [Planctomycetes bacterium]|nr:hypothetical protein [Planctomycetota bacterium]